jgi:hypothetical protein
MKTKRYFFSVFPSVLMLFAFILFPFQAVQAQGETEYSGTWKVRPLQFGEYYISYENVKETDQTNEIGLGYIHKSFVRATEKDKNTLSGFYDIFLDGDTYTISDANGIVMRMSQRNYTGSGGREAPYGFYHGFAATAKFLAFDGDLLREFPDEVIGRMYQGVLGLDYQVGYQVIIARHLTLELFGGIGGRVKVATAKLSHGRVEDRMIAPVKFSLDDNSTVGVAPALHLNMSLGYAF